MKKFLKKCFLFVFGLFLFSCEGNEIISSLINSSFNENTSLSSILNELEESISSLSTTSSKNTDFNYIVSNEEIIITGYKGHDKKVVIPSIIEVEGTTYSVTSIGDSAFYNYSSLTSIVIPNSVTSIGKEAFYGCSSLESMTIPFVGSDINAIGEKTLFGYIFGASSYLYNDDYVPSSLKEIIITGGTNISDSAFYNCSSLTSITIPNSVKSIGYEAFDKCKSLKNVYYSGTIEDWCNITFSLFDSNPMYYASNFYMLDENKEYKEVTRIEIPNTVTSIGSYQFCGFDNVTEIIILSSVTSIGYGAFYECSSLTTVTFEEGSQLTIIGKCAFFYCSSLTSIVIPNSVTSIRYSAFNECSSLTTITFEEGSQLTSIGDQAFSYCSSLTSITIPSSVTSIGEWAFDRCSSLTTVIFEEGSQLTSIGYSAFYNCSSLTSITIPSSVTSIGNYAFSNCSSLTIYCEATSIPSGWDSNWNDSNCPVVWGYKSN